MSRTVTLCCFFLLFVPTAGLLNAQSGFSGYNPPANPQNTVPATGYGNGQQQQIPQQTFPQQQVPQQQVPQQQVPQQQVPQQQVPQQQVYPQQTFPQQQNQPQGAGGYISTPLPNQPGAQPAAPPANEPLPPPFELSDGDQFRLNEFLAHWENFGKGIKRVSCAVHVREFDGGVFNKDSKVPMSHTWGQFRFLSPNKLLYHIKGEFTYIATQPGTDPKPEWKPSSNEAKIVYDGRALSQYDYAKKTVTVFPLPQDQWDQDLSMDGPFPLFFIANAEKLRKRFYLRLVTPEEKVRTDVWIEAFPRYPSDAQEFKSIILLLKIQDLQPFHMRRTRTNGKSYTDFEFQDVTINKGLWGIDAGIDPGWKRVEERPVSILPNKPANP